MTKDELHAAIKDASLLWYVRAIAHALIDAGLLTSLDCAAEICVLPSRELNLHSTHRRNRDFTTIDHVNGRGDERLRNLRLLHMACNSARTQRGKPLSPELKAKISAVQKANNTPRLCPKCGKSVRGNVGLRTHTRTSTCGDGLSPHKGKHLSPEHRAKLSVSGKRARAR